MNKCNGCGGFLAGAFLIIFTFVEWAAAKWIVFAIGVLMVLCSLGCKKGSCDMKDAPKKKVAKKKKK